MIIIKSMEKQKKTIFITGASSGIGRETALRLAKDGHKVFAGVRKKIDKDEIESLNTGVKGVYIDVSNPASIDKAFWFVLKNTDKIDVLINNAGIAEASPAEFISLNRLKKQFDVNTFGAMAVMQKFMPLLSGGRVINVSSMASYGIFPYVSAYCASKRALDILMNCFMLENKNNIKVVSIKPAVIKTPIWEKSIKRCEDEFLKLKETDRQKYQKEFDYMKKQALIAAKTGIEPYKAAAKIIEAVLAENPKPSYNIGAGAVFADWFSKLPLPLMNFFIKLKLNCIKG